MRVSLPPSSSRCVTRICVFALTLLALACSSGASPARPPATTGPESSTRTALAHMSRLLAETRSTLGLPVVKAFPPGECKNGEPNGLSFAYPNVSDIEGARLVSLARTYWRDSKTGELGHPHGVKNTNPGSGPGIFLISGDYSLGVAWDPGSKTLDIGGVATCR